jgi:hypothetical protein
VPTPVVIPEPVVAMPEPVVAEPAPEAASPAIPAPVAPAPVHVPPVESAPAPVVPSPEDAELVSPTLAELYFNQGFPEKAIQVYRRLLDRDPGNERARVRMAELQALAASPGGAKAAPADPPSSSAGADDGRAARRQALERTIERLESLRAALQKGAR